MEKKKSQGGSSNCMVRMEKVALPRGALKGRTR